MITVPSESEWRARVLAAWEPLARQYAAYELTEDSIAPLRGLVRELDAALFAGFGVYARERDRSGPTATSLADLGLE